MEFRYLVKLLAFLMVVLGWDWSIVLAKSSDNNGRATLAIEVGGGFTTYKSKIVESNDTSTTTGYRLLIHGGSTNSVAAIYENNTVATAFELNASAVTINYQDFQFRRYWGPAFIGPIFSTTSALINKEGTDLTDAMSSGIGGIFGVETLFSRSYLAYLNYRTINGTIGKDQLQTTFLVSNRTDLRIGAQLRQKGSWWYTDLGIRYTNFTVTIDGTSFAEFNLTSWVGLGASATF